MFSRYAHLVISFCNEALCFAKTYLVVGFERKNTDIHNPDAESWVSALFPGKLGVRTFARTFLVTAYNPAPGIGPLLMQRHLPHNASN